MFVLALWLLLLVQPPHVIAAQTGPGATTQAPLTSSQTTALEEAKRLNLELVEFFKQEKYSEALKTATQIRTLIVQNGLGDEPTALTMLGNVGEVLLAKGKESDAIGLFEGIIASYRKKLGPDSLPEAETTDRITRAYFNKGDYGKAEQYCLTLLPLLERHYGKDSAKVAGAYIFLGDIFRLEHKMEAADGSYQTGIAINDRAMTVEERSKRTDLDGYDCFLYHWGYQEDRMPDMIAKMAEFGRLRSEKAAAGRAATVVEGGVLNGTAIKLAKPSYPRGLGRLTGFVIVKVVIDESGTVSKATATCGIRQFLQVSEHAAMASRFTPTKLSGVPVKVTGTIIYNFGLH